ncbi:hypothetical protein KGA65_09125 [Ideonella sp. B7]|uniref:hypothetical protein n=1 Tax=Ideonella benzenivorans TaxID=2831643 RepID=UPI001CEC06B2|nr:hypothetical protein [Ideonella benzenivorans]MCA6216697.1 hypothetical protein [Ideonella benzenivorans]
MIRKPRCTRWRLSEVRAFWAKLAEDGRNDKQGVEKLLAATQKASQAARAKRAGLYLPAGA